MQGELYRVSIPTLRNTPKSLFLRHLSFTKKYMVGKRKDYRNQIVSVSAKHIDLWPFACNISIICKIHFNSLLVAVAMVTRAYLSPNCDHFTVQEPKKASCKWQHYILILAYLIALKKYTKQKVTVNSVNYYAPFASEGKCSTLHLVRNTCALPWQQNFLLILWSELKLQHNS